MVNNNESRGSSSRPFQRQRGQHGQPVSVVPLGSNSNGPVSSNNGPVSGNYIQYGGVVVSQEENVSSNNQNVGIGENIPPIATYIPSLNISRTINDLSTLLPHQREALKRVVKVMNHETFTLQKLGNTRSLEVQSRGQLFWLDPGTGKTTISAGIISMYLTKDTNPNLYPNEHTSIIVLSSLQNGKLNPPEKYIKEMKKHYAPFGEKILAQMPKRTGGLPPKRRVVFWSYKQFYNAFLKGENKNKNNKITNAPLSNTVKEFRENRNKKNIRFVFIIDEIHDLSSVQDPNETTMMGEILKWFLTIAPKKYLPSGRPMYTVYGMSATPGYTDRELSKTLCIVGPYKRGMTNNSAYCQSFVMASRRANMNINDPNRNLLDSLLKIFMKNVIFRREKNTMVNTDPKNKSGPKVSIFPKIEHKTILSPMNPLVYILIMIELGKYMKHTAYKNGNYRHSVLRRPGVEIGKSISEVGNIEKNIKETNKKLNTTIFLNGHLNPNHHAFMEYFSTNALYISENDINKLPLQSSMKRSILNQLKDRSKFKRVPVIPDTPKKTKAEQTRETEKIYYVPRGGKIDKLTQCLMKRGKSIVYVRDKTAGEIIRFILIKEYTSGLKGRNGNKVYQFKDRSLDYKKSYTSPKGMDLMFKKYTNRNQIKNILSETNTEKVIDYIVNNFIEKPIIEARKSNGTPTRVPERRFVLAKTRTVIANASRTMNGDERFEILLKILEQKVRALDRGSNLRNILKTRIRQIKEYNLDGDRLQILIIPGSDAYQGLDIKAIRHIHILDPIHKPGIMEQIVGRASRGYGHLGLKKEMRDATIYHYVDEPPKTFTELFHKEEYKNKQSVLSMVRNESSRSRLDRHKTMNFVKTKIQRMFAIPSGNTVTTDDITEKFMRGVDFVFHHQERLYTHNNRQKIKGYNNRTLTNLTPGNLTVNALMRTHREQHPNHLRIGKLYNNMKTIARNT